MRTLGRVTAASSVILAVGLGGLSTGPIAAPFAALTRLTVLISDLHLGVGVDPKSHEWHALEDFRWQEEFALFLKAIDQKGKGGTDLIVNGDAFELWESMERDCSHPDKNLGCTEAEALKRLQRVIAGHRAELRALGEFAGAGTNRIVLVPGNHDAALLFPSVAKAAIQAIPAPAGRIEVASAGYWLSADGLVYAEHGHQIGQDAYRFARWPAPFIRKAGQTHLERTWGEQLVQAFYNQHEARYPIIDNVSEEGMGVKYGLAAESGTAADAGRWLLFFLFKMSWQQTMRTAIYDLEDDIGQPPEWDIAKIRSQGDAFLVDALPPDDPFKGRAAKALAEGTLGLTAGDLTNEQIVAVCDYRAALRRARRRLEHGLTQLPKTGPPISECPRQASTVGPAFQYFWRSRDVIYGKYLEAIVAALKKAGRTEKPFAAFIQSHTHLGDQNFAPLSGVWKPVVANTGAWQRVIFPAQLEQIKKDRLQSDKDVLREFSLERLPRCYSFVWVEPYAERPAPALRYWRYTDGGNWDFAAPARGGITPCKEWLVSSSAPGPDVAIAQNVEQ